MADVVSIHQVPEKHGPATSLASATFLTGLGMNGVWRCRPNSSRQITIIEEEAVDALSKHLGIQIPSGATRRQVMIRGMRLASKIGSHIKLGPIIVKVEAICHPCERMEENVGPGAKEAMKENCGICDLVISGGDLKVGDPVTVPIYDQFAAAGFKRKQGQIFAKWSLLRGDVEREKIAAIRKIPFVFKVRLA